MQVRHLPNRDHRRGGATTLKCASAHVPRFLTRSVPPISDRQLPSNGDDSTGLFLRRKGGPRPETVFRMSRSSKGTDDDIRGYEDLKTESLARAKIKATDLTEQL